MKTVLMPATALAAMRKIALAIICVTLLMLVAAPARADVCSDNFPVSSCGVTITIIGTSGHLVATLGGSGTPYDTLEDQLVGITNSSSATVGAIVLSGPAVSEPVFGFDGDGPCVALITTTVCGSPFGYEGPRNSFVGVSSDKTTGKVLFNAPLAPGTTTWFALENVPNSVVAIGENKTLTAGQNTIFPFGPITQSGSTFTENATDDDYQINPLNSATGDNMTITPIPVAYAGANPFHATNFPTLSCVPYKDFSAPAPTLCVEVERDCFGSGCSALLYTAQLDFKIDGNTLPNGIGGAAFLGQHSVPCPTEGFDLNILVQYIGATIDPLKGSSGGGGSCFVAAFDPTAAPVNQGDTFSIFSGFTGLLAPPSLNLVNPGSAEPLNFHLSTPSGGAVANLHLCSSIDNTTCNSTTAKPWVNFGTLPITCATGVVIPGNFEVSIAAGGSNLQNLGGGNYRFNWKTSKQSQLGTCVVVITQFDSGLVVFPDNFKYQKQ